MTKLHIQVNQTMQFYRGQQGGSAPQRLFLSGGASIMPYTAQFFAEKLNVPVEYFNPFRNVQIDPAVNLEDLSRVAHALGEVVGLGLRNLANCPVEMNLMPESTLRWQALNQKKPYLVATVFSLVLVALAIGFLFQELAASKQAEIDRITPEVDNETHKSDVFNAANTKLQQSRKQADQIVALLQERYYWGDFLTEMRSALIRAEAGIQNKLSAQKPGVEVGVWIEQITGPAASGAPGSPGAPMPPQMPMDPRFQQAQPPPVAGAAPAGVDTNAITLICRAVSLKVIVDNSANNKDIAYSVRDQIANSPMVNPDPKLTQLVGDISQDDANGTFTFTVSVEPLNPLKF